MNTELLRELVNKYPEEVIEPFDVILKVIGFDGVIALTEEVGGSSIYVPNAKSIFMGCIGKQIKEDYNGRNLRELCKTYGYCDRTVKTILERY